MLNTGLSVWLLPLITNTKKVNATFCLHFWYLDISQYMVRAKEKKTGDGDKRHKTFCFPQKYTSSPDLVIIHGGETVLSIRVREANITFT